MASFLLVTLLIIGIWIIPTDTLHSHDWNPLNGTISGCFCKNVTLPNSDDEMSSECRCQGEGIKKISNDMPAIIKRLTLMEADLDTLRQSDLQRYKQLQDLTLTNLRNFHTIEPKAFSDLLELRTIYIYHAPLLVNLSVDVFDVFLPKLKILRIVNSALNHIPLLHKLRTDNPLHMIDLDNNQITNISSHSVNVRTEQMTLNYNVITEIENNAFQNSEIASLSLKGNRFLRYLHKDAFLGVRSLRYLDLSDTNIQTLPTNGLRDVEILKIEHTYSMKVFPSIYNFKFIQEAWLTYPYHCCAFQYPATHDPNNYASYQLQVENLKKNCTSSYDSSQNISENWVNDESWELLELLSSKFIAEPDPDIPDEVFHTNDITVQPSSKHVMCGILSKNYREVKCFPEPDPFNPCEDLMGNWALRVAVWFVAVAALFGNVAVLVVLLSSRFRMTVPKFLMCNLALADFFMGVYLMMIAVMDVRSIGDYFNHAIYWQRGAGCQVAGFLTVFSCVLSVFTLMVITSERWYTITYAIHLNKRLRLSEAVKIMAVGWMYAILTAALPLFGISGYSKTSICLPMENSKFWDNVYLFVLLIFDGVAFWIICACYAKMYAAVKGGQEAVASVARSDMTVAKRMALLVFTDFACWAPIAFFGLTALFGLPLIDVSKTKILLVFFYPLNSCANPYLYALLTQQYRRDLFVLLSRYGICSKRAAKYKGTTGALQRGVCRRNTLSANVDRDLIRSKTPDHRGSVLTTVTSVDYLSSSTRPSSFTGSANMQRASSAFQIELLPMNGSCANRQPLISNNFN